MLDNSVAFEQHLDVNKREFLPIHYHTDKQQAWPFFLQESVRS
jgi:hypothetical protein